MQKYTIMTQVLKKEVSAKTTAVVFGVLIIACLFAFYVRAAWNEPTQPPPAGNVPAPINTGSTSQEKTGDLKVENLTALEKVTAAEFQDITSGYYLNLSGMGNLGGPIGIAPTGGGGTVAINATGDIKITSGTYSYYHNGKVGKTLSCGTGNLLKDVQISGGIVTGGGCVTCTKDQILKYNDSGQWACAADETGVGGIGSCADCDTRFVNVTGDTMTGNLTVNTQITSPEYCIDGDCITNWPVKTEENLRIVRGRVNANGTVANGSGFDVAKETVALDSRCVESGITNTTGNYIITFTSAFTNLPTVVASLDHPGVSGATLYVEVVDDGFNNKVKIHPRRRYEMGGDTSHAFCPRDYRFDFIAVGS